jgi:hypothetical protein
VLIIGALPRWLSEPVPAISKCKNDFPSANNSKNAAAVQEPPVESLPILLISAIKELLIDS